MGITVGIATRNAEWCLPYCFMSLNEQTVQPDEYVICIGPGDDKTDELVQEFVNQTTVPVKILRDEEGVGTGYARKSIVENATQEYVCWIDSDEIYPSNWIEVILLLIGKYRFDILNRSTNNWEEITLKEFLQTGEKLPNDIDVSSLSLKWGAPHHVCVVKRDIVIRVGNYDPFFPRGQDEDLRIRLNVIGIKGIVCKELHFLHIGLLDRYSKMFVRSAFFRFLYKYGFKYMLLGGVHTEHSLAFLVRSVFMVSLLGLIFGPFIGVPFLCPLIILLISVGGLLSGVVFKHRSLGFKLSLYIIQLGKCFGEYYTLYKILKDKNRKGFGYGKRWLVRMVSRNGEVI